jgi:predicted phosphoribosyltransferase
MGAIAMDGTVVFNDEIMHEINISKAVIDHVIKTEEDELKRREIKYRGNRPFPKLAGKKIILVDDGIATGATMRAAIQALLKHKPTSIIIAVPVAGISTCEEMEQIADKVICPLKPEFFYAVGQWYQDFSQTSDEEVYELLNKVDGTNR